MQKNYPHVTAIGQVIDELVRRFTIVLPEVVVSDGFYFGNSRFDRILEIGVEDFESPTSAYAARSSLRWAGLGNFARDEDLTVNCSAAASSPDRVQKHARDKALAIVTACQAELAREPVIGETVHSLVSDIEIRQGLDKQNGAIAQIPFSIRVKARIVLPPKN